MAAARRVPLVAAQPSAARAAVAQEELTTAGANVALLGAGLLAACFWGALATRIALARGGSGAR